ncbi:MAG: GspE/PulE family protein [Burkholderiales bacterium]
MNAPLPRKTMLTQEDLLRARQAAGTDGRSLLAALRAGSAQDDADFVIALGALCRMPVLRVPDMQACKPALELLSLPRAQSRDCVLLHKGDELAGVVADPFDAALADWLEAQAGRRVRWHVAALADIQAYLTRLEVSVNAFDSLGVAGVAPRDATARADALTLQSISNDDSAPVRLVNSTLYDAFRQGASDVHLRRTADGTRIKYRIDGVLVGVGHVDGAELADQMVSHIKVRAELDIAEHRVPQDGKFQVVFGGRAIDLRVSVMPTIHGEGVVLRILDKQTVVGADGRLHLDELGFDATTLTELRSLIALPYGMLMVTGPTGSGKTTTLYAAISEINRGSDNFMTVEDPPEYQFDDVAQIRVNEKQGLTFAVGLRSILRHDPDKIMVGEIRDRETAEMAIQAALTGHGVFTTLHANNSFDVFSRLAYMSIDPYALTSALNGIWAQRLLRVNCAECAKPYQPGAAELAALGADAGTLTGARFMRGSGCGACHGTGYRGRRAIAEIMTMTDRLRELIAGKAPIAAIKEEARRGGTRSLRQAALGMLVGGETTLEEVVRVTVAT